MERMDIYAKNNFCYLGNMESYGFTKYKIYQGEQAIIEKKNGVMKKKVSSNGISKSNSIAKMKCIMEGIERRAFMFPPIEKLYNISEEQLSRECINYISPNEMIQFDLDAYKNKIVSKYDKSDNIYWVDGRDFVSNEKYLIPAHQVFGERCESKFYDFSISTGAAAEFIKEKAIIAGINEVIERDHFMLTWKKTRSIPEIDWWTVEINDYQIKGMIEEFQENAGDLHIFDMTSELGVPAILGINIEHIGRKKMVNVETVVSTSYKKCLIKLIEGLIMIRMWQITHKDSKVINDHFEIRTLEDRGIYYSNLKDITDFEFLLKDNSKIEINEYLVKPELTFDEYRKIFIDNNIKCYIVDMTPKDMKNAGVYVIKSIVPSFLKLDIDHNYLYMNCDRLKQGDKFMNCAPHPFT